MEHQRYEYDLNSGSVVLDLGGYEGTFARLIHEKYKCNVFVFEPVAAYYERLKALASDKIKVFHYGIGDSNRTATISIRNDSSSIFRDGEQREEIAIRKLSDVLGELNIQHVDLIKINVEGSEYEILENMIAEGLVTKFRDIQVQFHDFFHNAVQRREIIRQRLAETHYLTYDYPFIWENHRRK